MTPSEYMGYLEDNPPTQVNGMQYCIQLYALARSIKAVNVLELGLGWGHSTRAFAAAIGSLGGGNITSVDLSDSIGAYHDEYMAKCNVKWMPVVSDISAYTHAGSIDLLYIDENPDNTLSDFHNFYNSVVPGGLIVMDGVGNKPFDKQPTATKAVVDLTELGYQIVSLPYCPEYCHAVYRKEG